MSNEIEKLNKKNYKLNVFEGLCKYMRLRGQVIKGDKPWNLKFFVLESNFYQILFLKPINTTPLSVLLKLSLSLSQYNFQTNKNLQPIINI